jgi:MFS family permease
MMLSTAEAPPAEVAEPTATSVGILCGLYLAPTALGFSAAPVALPTLAADLHASGGSSAWALVAYSLTTAVLTALAGNIADRRGLRPPAVLSAAALIVGSGLILTAGDLPLVVLGRLVQGVGAGAVGVTAFRLPSLLISDARLRGRALGVMGSVVGVASGTGPLLGGALTTWWSWRGALALPLLSAAVIGNVLRRTPSATPSAARLDVRGATLTAAGIAAVTVLIEARTTGLAVPVTIAVAVLVACPPSQSIYTCGRDRTASCRSTCSASGSSGSPPPPASPSSPATSSWCSLRRS